MNSDEMHRLLAEVKVKSVQVFFTKKHLDHKRLRDMVAVWTGIGPREVKHFIWPKVIIEGPVGTKSFPLTWWNPNVPQTKLQPGHLTDLEKIVLRGAIGKVVKVSGKKRDLVRAYAAQLKSKIDSRVDAAARRKDLTAKVESIRRKFRRQGASAILRKVMEDHLGDLTDYDVLETWKDVKRTARVREVMES